MPDGTHKWHSVLKELAAISPLEDSAFKILLKDDEQFATLAESASGIRLDAGGITSINGEIVLHADGKLIRMDSLRETDAGYFNLESQVQEQGFPFKRHLLYWAFAYANGIKPGDPFTALRTCVQCPKC